MDDWIDVQEDDGWSDVGSTSEDYTAKPTIDTSNMDMGQTRESGVYEAPIGEDTGGTISPQEVQKREDDKVMRSIGEDMESLRTATTSTVGSVMGNTEKMDEEAVRLIKDKYDGVVQNRGGEKVIALPNGSTIPYPTDGSLVESILANKGEMGGAVGGALLGAKVGAVGGPVGATVGAAIGGAVGAGAGAYYDVGEAAEETGTEVTEEERTNLAMTAGVTDLALGVAGAGVIKAVGKILTPTQIKEFTSIAELPKRERKAVEEMMKKSDMNEEDMTKSILDYAKTQKDDVITNSQAVEAASKGSESEQLGYTIEAMKRDDTVKAKVLNEATERSNIVEQAVKDDEELAGYLQRRTLDDEGRRKATNWNGLQQDLERAGFEEGDTVYDMVASNARSLGNKDTDIFQATVKAIKPEDKAHEFVQPWTETTRGSGQTQMFATTLTVVDKVLSKILPNADKRTLDTVTKAIKSSIAKPKELEQQLVNEGIEKVQAKRIAQQMEIESAKQAKIDEKVAVRESAKKAKEFDAIQKADAKQGSAIEAGIKKDVAEFKKTKATMQKEDKAQKALEVKESKEDLKLHKEAMKRDAHDWDMENITATVSTKDKTRLKEARRRAQIDAEVMKETASDTAVLKIQKEILDKKQASTDRKAKVTKLKAQADKPPKEKESSAMMAGLKQPELPLEPSLFDEKTKKIHMPKRRKSTPNQIEAKKVQEANPDDKEAIKKALTRKSPEVQAKNRAEEQLARADYERSLDPRTDAEIKANDAVDKALEDGIDLYDTKPIFKKTLVSETIPSRAKEFGKWMDENPTKEFLHYAKEKELSTKEVKSYYDGLGKDIPKSWVEPKKKPKKAMKAGIQKDFTEELGKDGQKAYEAWASDVRKYAKEGTYPNTSLSKFKRSTSGKAYR